MERHLDPDSFLARAQQQAGAWWPQWLDWLGARSRDPVPAAEPGSIGGLEPLYDAPGQYVRQS